MKICEGEGAARVVSARHDWNLEEAPFIEMFEGNLDLTGLDYNRLGCTCMS